MKFNNLKVFGVPQSFIKVKVWKIQVKVNREFSRTEDNPGTNKEVINIFTNPELSINV